MSVVCGLHLSEQGDNLSRPASSSASINKFFCCKEKISKSTIINTNY